MNKYDALLDTDVEFVSFLNSAYNDGYNAMKNAVLEAEQTGVFTKPDNPYGKILLRLIHERKEAEKDFVENSETLLKEM